MSWTKIQTLPEYAYEDNTSITVAVESQLSYILGDKMDLFSESSARAGQVSWFEFLSTFNYEGELGLSLVFNSASVKDYVKIRGNGFLFGITLLTEAAEVSVTYDHESRDITLNTVPYRLDLPEIESLHGELTLDFIWEMLTRLVKPLITWVFDTTSAKYSNTKYLPEFYYQTPDSIPVLAENIITKTADEIESYPFNNWTNIEVLRREFKLEEILDLDSPVLNIASPSLLKGLFKIKGTDVGLHFLLKFYKAEVTVLYKDDIIGSHLENLAEDITDCDIVIDLSFGGDISIGVKKNPDGTAARDNLGRIIFEDTDTKLKGWFHQIMQVCLNILAITYTKWIEETHYRDFPPEGIIEDDEVNTTRTRYFLRVPDEYICDPKNLPKPFKYTTGHIYGAGDSYIPDPYKPGLAIYGTGSYYKEGYRYYPTLDPVDFGRAKVVDCPWIAPSRFNNIDILNTFSSKAVVARFDRYGTGKRYSPTGIQYIDSDSYNGDILIQDTLKSEFSETFTEPKLNTFDTLIPGLTHTFEDTVSLNAGGPEFGQDLYYGDDVYFDEVKTNSEEEVFVSSKLSFGNTTKYGTASRYGSGMIYFNRDAETREESITSLSTQVAYTSNFNVFIDET